MSSDDTSSDDHTSAIEHVPNAELIHGTDTMRNGSPLGYLLVVAGPQVARVYPLDASNRIVGRSPRADIVVPEKAVSAQHACVGFDGQHHFVKDLGSTNQTFVNDTPVKGQVLLRVGDTLRVGQTVLVYLTSEPTDEDRTRAFGGAQLQQSLVASPQVPSAELVHVSQSATEEPSALEELVDKYLLIAAFTQRYWKLVLATALLVAGAGAAHGILRPPVSTAEFDIALSPEARDNPLENSRNQTRELQFFDSAERNFVDKKLVAETLKALGEKDPSPGLVGAHVGALAFESTGRNTFKGSYKHENPKYAETFLREHVRLYLESEVGKALKLLRSEVDLLGSQVTDTRKKLQNTEKALRELKEENPDGLPEQASGQVGTRIAMRTRSAELSAQVQMYQLQLRNARTQLASGDAVFQRKVQKAEPHEAQLTAIRQKIIDARARGLGDEHPEVIQLKTQERELARLQQQVINSRTTEADTRANPAQQATATKIADLQAAIAGAQAELGGIGSQLSQLDDVAEKLPEVEAKFLELTRTYDSTKKLHGMLFEQLKARELQLEVERASVESRYEILEPPKAQTIQLRQVVMKRAGLGGAAGTIVGIFLAILHALRAFIRQRQAALRAQMASQSRSIVVAKP